MPSYILRNIDPDLWARVKARAETEGRPLRWLLLKLLDCYAARGFDAMTEDAAAASRIVSKQR